MIPKTEGTFGQVSVADMRPIAIQPVLCRIISSAFAQRIETKEWLQNLIQITLTEQLRVEMLPLHC